MQRLGRNPESMTTVAPATPRGSDAKLAYRPRISALGRIPSSVDRYLSGAIPIQVFSIQVLED